MNQCERYPLKGRVAVVTGSGSGLGAATATALIDAGACVALIDRVPSERGHGSGQGRLCEYVADITDEHGLETVFRQIESDLGCVSILVNCAGVGTPDPIVRNGQPIALSECRKVIEINLIGTLNAIRCAVPQMINRQASMERDEDAAVIINVSSISAFEGQINQSVYSASKGGVIGLVLPLARELGEYSIRVLGIAPGVFATPMTLDLPTKARDALFSMPAPFPRQPGEPRYFAGLVMAIISNPMLNGEVIRLDGALRLPAKA